MTASSTDALTGQTVELLQTLIRNECVNDGSPTSGHESRSAEVLQSFLEGSGLEIERYEPTPGRASLVARMAGTDPDAASVCLMGHTDVVPVNPHGWSRDPFGGEIVDGEVWGRGAVDMLNLTSSMAVAVRALARRGFRPRGDLIYFAVADEESGSAHGAQWMADHAAESIRCDYLLTESGGVHSGPSDAPFIGVNVGENRDPDANGRSGDGNHRRTAPFVDCHGRIGRVGERADRAVCAHGRSSDAAERAVAAQVAQGAVHHEDPTVQAEHGHADGGVLHRQPPQLGAVPGLVHANLPSKKA